MSNFVELLHKSYPAVMAIAYRVFISKGYGVYFPPVKLAKDREHYKDGVDEGDMILDHNGENKRIEVKQSSKEFTCAEDWPYKRFFICSTNSYDSAKVKPHGYIFTNPSMTHIATLNVIKTIHTWKIAKDVETPGRAEVQDVYWTTVDQLNFKPMPSDSIVRIES